MNEDTIKGVLQKIGGRVEQSAGSIVGDHPLQEAGQEDQLKGSAREAEGDAKDVEHAPSDLKRAARRDATNKSATAEAFEHEHDAAGGH